MTPWTFRLIAANAVLFAITLSAGRSDTLGAIVNALVLVPALIPQRPWTVLTYAFLHADLMHILFNMIGLFFFGPRLENALGGGRFLGLYLTATIAAALASLVTPLTAVVGASGAVFGVLVGFAKYWPRDRIYFWGVVPIEARWFIVLLAAYSIFAGFSRGSGVAHFAHLGGLVGGWLYLKVLEHRSPARRFRKKASPGFGRIGAADLARWRRIPRESLHPLNREELDRIMRKVEKQGPESLDREERQYLERLSPSGDSN